MKQHVTTKHTMSVPEYSDRYRYCADDEANAVAESVVRCCVSRLNGYGFGSERLASVILTGSFSRGEGSILRHSARVNSVLGDVEFLVLFDCNRISKSTRTELNALARAVEDVLVADGTACKVEFSPITRSFFRKIRPGIFTYELLRFGKVVCGDETVTKLMPAFGSDAIPAIEGYYLLCNRIVEQLIVIEGLKTKTNFDFTQKAYQLIKFYIDMAGSYLVVNGQYKPTYSDRKDAFNGHGGQLEFLAPQEAAVFADRLRSATEYKLAPSAAVLEKFTGTSESSSEMFMSLYREAGHFCRKLWTWEIATLLSCLPGKFSDNPWEALNRSFPVPDLLRGWLKFAKNVGISLPSFASFRCWKMVASGPPRMLIYTAAAHLYFSMIDNDVIDLDKFSSILPVSCHAQSASEATATVINAWEKYVRSA